MSSFHSMNKKIKPNDLRLIVENYSHYLRLSSIFFRGKQLDDDIITHVYASRKRPVLQAFVENILQQLFMTQDQHLLCTAWESRWVTGGHACYIYYTGQLALCCLYFCRCVIRRLSQSMFGSFYKYPSWFYEGTCR